MTIFLVLRDGHSGEYPQIPILRDLGYDISCPIFMGVQAPKGIPGGIAKKIEDAFINVMKGQTFINGMKEIRYPIVYRNSNGLNNYISHNFKIYEKIVKDTLK
jgi:tripartite-type tricarboxylate transporter receptor subunit TctC